MYSRSAIDSVILEAAGTGADPLVVGAEAGRLSQQVDDELLETRQLFSKGQASDALFVSFDAMVVAMRLYVADAVALTGLLSANPAVVPAHLVEMRDSALELERRQFAFGDQVIATTEAARADTTSSVDLARARILMATGAAVITLLLLAVAMDRRIRASAGARAAAESAKRDASALLVEQVERQDFAEDLREALDGALDERMTLDVVERALRQLPLGGVAEVLLADSSSAHVGRVASTSNAPGCDVESPNDCPAVRPGDDVRVERRTPRLPPSARSPRGTAVRYVCADAVQRTRHRRTACDRARR